MVYHVTKEIPMIAEIKYEIVKELGIISEKSGGWTKQLNLISWNGEPPKYDIRDWGPNRQRMGKGVTLTAAELQTLTELLDEIEL